jgi:hypothetical protein
MNGEWLDVHGAGAQRSDPKEGVPNPYGHGPQGDVVRIYNYVRCVRGDTSTEVGDGDDGANVPLRVVLYQNRPNPFNPVTTISFSLPEEGRVVMRVFNVAGRPIATLFDGYLKAGDHEKRWAPDDTPGGVYFCALAAGDRRESIKMLLLR